MIRLTVAYLIYNILAGIFLLVRNNRKEKTRLETKEFFQVLFFPALGLGKLRYKQKISSANSVEFTERWFMWKYMIKVNWGFIITMGIVVFAILLAFGGFFSNGDFSQNADTLDLFAGMGMFVLLIVFLLITAVTLAILYLLLIYVPKNNLKKIEAGFNKQKHLPEEPKGKAVM